MLRITVKFQQQQFNVESMGSRKIQEFIERLINQLKLAPGTFYGLFMQNTQLQNTQSFVENKVQTGAVLELKPVKQVNFGFVKVMNNNTPKFMQTDLCEQCEKLYNEVAAKISKPMNSFTLEFSGRILEKQRPLKDQGIVSNSIINVVYSGDQVNQNAQLNVRIQYSNQNLLIQRVSKQALISQIEQKVKQKFNLTSEVYMTTQDGLRLQSQQPISSYNLPENAQLNAVVQNQLNQSAPIQSQQQNSSTNQKSPPILQQSAPINLPQQYSPFNQPQQVGSRKIILQTEYQGTVKNIQMDNSILVSELDETLQKAYQINQPVQLISNGIPLISNQTLAQQGLQNGSRLILQIKPQQPASVPQQPKQSSSEQLRRYQTSPQNLVQQNQSQHLNEYEQFISNVSKDQQREEYSSQEQCSQMKNVVLCDNRLSDSKVAELEAAQFKSEVNRIPSDQIIAQITIFSDYRSKHSNQQVQQIKLIIIFNENNYFIGVDGSMLIQDIENHFKHNLGIEKPVQLIYDNQVLSSNQTINQLEIESESFFLLEIKSEQSSSKDNKPTKDIQKSENTNLEKFVLQIKQEGSQCNLMFQTASDTKMLLIKNKILKILNITEPIQFRFDGKILPSDQSFNELGLTKGSRIIVQLKSQLEPQVQQQQIQKEQKVNEEKIATEKVLIQHGTIIINAELSTNVTILVLEECLQKEFQIYEPVGLMFNGQLLNSNQTLQQVGIKQGSTLVVQKKSQLQQTQIQTSSQPIPQLSTKLTLLLDFNGQVFNVEFPRDTLISEIEDSMKEQLGLNEGVQILQENVPLPSNQTLQQLNIKNESKIKIQAIISTKPPSSPTQKKNQEGKLIELIFQHEDKKKKILVVDTICVSKFEKVLQTNFGLTGKLSLFNNRQLLNYNMSFKEQNVIEGTILKIVNTVMSDKFEGSPLQEKIKIQKQSQNEIREKLKQFYTPNPDYIYGGPISRKVIIFIEYKKKTQTIKSYGNTFIFELEENLQQVENIQLPVNLLFQDSILPSNQTLDSLGLQTLSKLVMQIEPKLNPLIQQQKQMLQSKILHSENLKLSIQYGLLILEVKFYSDASVEQLEKLFEQELLIKEPINLIFNNKVLPSNLTLKQAGIKNTNSLVIEKKSESQNRLPPPIQIEPESIKTILLRIYFEGNYLPIETNYSTLISEMKMILQKQLNLQNQLTLSLGLSELPSQLSIQQLNLKSNDVLVLVQIDKIKLTVNVRNEDLIFLVRSDSFVCDLMDLIKQEKKIFNRTELIHESQTLIPQLSFKFQKVEFGAYLLLVESEFEVDQTLIKWIK